MQYPISLLKLVTSTNGVTPLLEGHGPVAKVKSTEVELCGGRKKARSYRRYFREGTELFSSSHFLHMTCQGPLGTNLQLRYVLAFVQHQDRY